MLTAIMKIFSESFVIEETDDIERQLQLATAALLIEVMKQDHSIHPEERTAVKAALQENFSLTDDETQALFDLAKQQADSAVDYYQFTSLIAKECSPEQKIRIMEYLWMIAYADTQLDALEEHMIRRIADLIYVPHRDFIQTKLKIERSLRH